MTFQQYALRVKHDGGIVTIRTHASSEESARNIIMSAERCPARSILSVKVVKSYPTKSELEARLRPNAVECFHVDAREARMNRAQQNKLPSYAADAPHLTNAGWYFWTCLPGCLPDSDPFGPYASPLAVLRAAYDADFLPDPQPEEPDFVEVTSDVWADFTSDYRTRQTEVQHSTGSDMNSFEVTTGKMIARVFYGTDGKAKTYVIARGIAKDCPKITHTFNKQGE